VTDFGVGHWKLAGSLLSDFRSEVVGLRALTGQDFHAHQSLRDNMTRE
jgi:hypothetical protein